jgi:NAD(P)-dependent dehydrogenase (short-subunit alcohol dehydrogenase family)
LTAALAREFAPTVAVNAVAPSFVATDMAESWSATARAQVSKALLPRPATALEVAEVICFLASERARFITGQTFTVDGGYSIAPR